MDLFRTLDQPVWKAHALNTVGWHAAWLGDYDTALTLYRGLTNTYQVADTLDRLGHPHAVLSHRDHARPVWQKALQLYREQGRDQDAERVRQQLDALDHPDGNQPPEPTETAK